MDKIRRRKVKVAEVCPITEKIGRIRECFVGVSISNPIFRKKNMIEVLKWINKNFDRVEIIIADSLQRYNEMTFNGLTRKKAFEKTKKLGDEYLEIILELKYLMADCEIKISRWEEYRNKKGVKAWKKFLFRQYKENAKFNQELLMTVKNYHLKRLEKNSNDQDNSHVIIDHSIQYLLEEMAFISYYIQDEVKVSVYPGTQLNILKDFSKGTFPEIKCPLSKGVYVDLNIKKIK